jgi:small-conductance mechanosensitive channel
VLGISTYNTQKKLSQYTEITQLQDLRNQKQTLVNQRSVLDEKILQYDEQIETIKTSLKNKLNLYSQVKQQPQTINQKMLELEKSDELGK